MITEILEQAEVVTPTVIEAISSNKELEVSDFLPCRPACD